MLHALSPPLAAQYTQLNSSNVYIEQDSSKIKYVPSSKYNIIN